ncbi:MAG: uroporphyrinogen decarboxylase family protein [Spirochaetales bacterium]|uniref:Uroporphyrinogen decarboxylase family protein n=1 Tax=Candidatus Thalassospirochaeta sargassi TaxID=3119039 RepID=A0AAJ1ICR4_9SPIO|nr:uroporphyrinogen decarboxylase family protein [Spirochaetales bacterium]
MELTSRQRVLYTLTGRQPDMIPITEFLYSRPFYKEMIGYVPEVYNAEDIIKCSQKVGYDLAVIPLGGYSGMTNQDGKGYEYTDEWGIKYRKSEVTWPADAPIEHPLSNRNDWDNYDFPSPEDGDRTAEIRLAKKMAKETDMAIIGNIRGPFTPTWLLFGMTHFSMLMYDDPALIHEVMRKYTDFFIRGAEMLVDEGADAILFADDYGFNTAPLIAPAQFKEFVIPYLAEYSVKIKSLGVPLIMHSDGNLNSLIEMIFDTGISNYNPVEKAAEMDLAGLRKIYGSNKVFWGNINNKTTLVTGTPEDIEQEVKECIKAAAGGGHILSSDHSIHDDTKIENILALYEAGRKHGKHPFKFD